ncbi:RIPOR family member 3 isoform X9 [Carcharodon carcharias]|uniref:RIPOR family member 3 isoform X9 n=1 Tax=Carcharodon carcharias TaxID=13397 RepID=UPI001B7E5065|nr:RIPOR family member 3 isoform X9 [Carcharodon carcharias]
MILMENVVWVMHVVARGASCPRENQGIVSKSLGIMSVKLHFASPADSSGVNRSRSFAGFGSLQSRRTHLSSGGRSSPRLRLLSVKSTKRHVISQKNSSSLEPQPNRVEKICKSLRKGLNEYLEVHQNELDLLTMQQKDMKRNSRLAFLYDLDKQIRTTERYIRKLEFHISRIEELYESYFIQWRLRNGANNMKQAYSVSPSTKGSRETLIEINRNYRECTEDMCVIERTLEILLGEFHIRMKGLIGFARLCPGDHYAVLIKYGRQRWKLKGKIDADDRQTWDEEEMAFLPHINEDIEIKVAEMKGLMTVLVGTVTCESADFFSAQPQIMIVDITDLGTMKLQLEIMWDPFDNDEVSVTSGSITKFSLPSRKGSVNNWTPPSTPSFRDKYFSREITDSSSTSTVSLTVETVLESFNFLNADSSEDNLSCSGSIRIKDERTGTYSKGNICQHDLLTKNGDLGIKATGTLALTSEDVSLDQALLTHLQLCKRLLQRFTSTGCAAVLQNCILEELSQQILVLENLALICHEKSGNIKSVEEVIPKSKVGKSVLSFWGKCTETDCLLYLSAEKFLMQLRNCYTQKVAARYPGQTERVFRTLLYQIVSCCELLLCPNVSEEVVTVFQFFNYVKKYNITQLGTHLTRLAKEVFLPEALQAAQKMKTLKKLKEKLISELQPLHQTLQSISILQLDENPKVTQVVTSFLRSALGNNIFRVKALAYYTETLQEKDPQLQRAACMALKQLKAVESIEQIASLCRSQRVNVRDTAREVLHSFGEKGHLAFEKVDMLWYEGSMNRNSTTEITIL